MREGFNVYIDDQDRLVSAIADSKLIRWLEPVGIADSLIEFIEYDFSGYWTIIESIYEFPIFGEYMDTRAKNFEDTLDVHFEDFEDCREFCRDVAEELEDPVGSFFICRELDRIDAKQDNGSASFWLNQANDMVEALRSVVYAHTFISRAFDTCFGNDDGNSLPQRAQTFFKAYTDLELHIFAETFTFYPQTDGKLNYKHMRGLMKNFNTDSDGYYNALHKGRQSLSITRGHLMRTHKELLFFSFLELLRRDARIRRCDCCGGYFVPRTKKKTLYCDRAVKGGKTCKDIGPKRTQRLSKEQDIPLREYDRIYKMYHSRAERYECRFDLNRERTANDLTYDEFYLWSAKAAATRKRYIAEELSAKEFIGSIALDEKDIRADLDLDKLEEGKYNV